MALSAKDIENIKSAYKRVRPECKSDREAFDVMKATLGFKRTTMQKYTEGLFRGETSNQIEDFGRPLTDDVWHIPIPETNGAVEMPNLDKKLFELVGKPYPAEPLDATAPNGNVGKTSFRPHDTQPEPPPVRTPKLPRPKVELFATDIHFPFEDKPSYELFVEAVRKVQPDIVYLNGDIIDGYSVSQWDKDPNVSHENNIQVEFDYCYEKLVELRNVAPNAQFYFKDGNHEDRFNRFLNKNAPALRALRSLSVKSQLQLDKLEFSHIQQNDKKCIGNLWHIHGHEVKGAGINVAMNKLRKMFANVIFGHHHVQQSAVIRKYDGDMIGAWSIGCLADFNQDYVHHAESWCHGFAKIEYLPSGLFHVQPIEILHNGKSATCNVAGEWLER